MLDPKLLRSDLSQVAAQLARRGFVLDVAAFASLEERRKLLQIDADRLRAERNAGAKAVGHAKAQGQDAAPLLARGEALGAELQEVEKQLEGIQSQMSRCAAGASRDDSTSNRGTMWPSARTWEWTSRRRGGFPGRGSWS